MERDIYVTFGVHLENSLKSIFDNEQDIHKFKAECHSYFKSDFDTEIRKKVPTLVFIDYATSFSPTIEIPPTKRYYVLYRESYSKIGICIRTIDFVSPSEEIK